MIEEPIIKSDLSCLKETLHASGIPLHRCMIVGDTVTLPLYGQKLADAVRDEFTEVHSYAFPAGEQHKNLQSIEDLIRELLANHFDRKDVIFALGGGVVGDMAGFAAAIYLRGIRVVQFPTTLLAMIDSAIGGKTAVDFEGYKNMVGAFHMPEFVYTDISTLKTLPDSQFTAGMGEVVKSAVLADAELYGWLRKNAGGIMAREPDLLFEMVNRTCPIKVGIVHRDPTEKGERALLNLGHTIGHAIEKYKNFTMLHGDCVGLGLIAAAAISARRGLISKEDAEDLRHTCGSFGLPVVTDGLDAAEILRITKSDKKMSNGQIRFILIRKIGEAFFTDDVTDEELLFGIRAVMG